MPEPSLKLTHQSVEPARKHQSNGSGVLLTIVIPTQNRAADLERLLGEIGTHADLEVIVVDDASKAVVAAANAKTVSSSPGVRFVGLGKRGGAPVARNIGARLASGRFLWFFDDDDSLPRKTIDGVLARLHERDVDVALMSSTFIRSGRKIGEYRPSRERDSFASYRDRGQMVSPPCVVVARSFFNEVGGWDERLVAGQDTDLLLRLSAAAPLTVWDDLEVEINVGDGPRITNQIWRQQRAKCQFLMKHWYVLSWRRRCYYVGSFLLVIPFWKKLSGRSVAREILKRSKES